MSNKDFLKKLLEISKLFDSGVNISIDAENTLSIDGTNYFGFEEAPSVSYKYEIPISYDDNLEIEDILTPLIERIVADSKVC